MAGCYSGRNKTLRSSKAVDVPTPVLVRIDAKLTEDCKVNYPYPSDDLLVLYLINRLNAVELAIEKCNKDKLLIREAQEKAFSGSR